MIELLRQRSLRVLVTVYFSLLELTTIPYLNPIFLLQIYIVSKYRNKSHLPIGFIITIICGNKILNAQWKNEAEIGTRTSGFRT